MQNNQSPIGLGVFNELNLSQLSLTEEDRIISQIKNMNWSAVPFCKIEVRVRAGKPCTVILEKTYKLD